MKLLLKKKGLIEEPREDFRLGAAIAMIVLVLSFIGASFYILISSYLEVNS